MIIQCIYVGPSGSGHHQCPSSLLAISEQMTRMISLSRQSSLSNPTHTILTQLSRQSSLTLLRTQTTLQPLHLALTTGQCRSQLLCFLGPIWLLSKVRYFFFYSVSHQPHACPPHRHLGPSCSHLHLDMMLVSPQLPHLIYSARKDTSRLNL